MTQPAEHITTCEAICVKCGDATQIAVDNKILTQIPKGTKRHVTITGGCAICHKDKFLLMTPKTNNAIDDMLT